MAEEDPMRRLRGHTGCPPDWGRRQDRRGRDASWVPEKRGPLICSRMAYRSGDQHAPVFDVDLPLVAVRQAGGGSGLVLTGLLGTSRLRGLWQGLAFLRRHGYVRDEDVPVVQAQLRTAMDSDPAGRLVLPLCVPARTVPSANPRHRHLYVDTVMSFAESVRLAKALGFVDPDHIARCRRLGRWEVRLAWRPPAEPRSAERRPAVEGSPVGPGSAAGPTRVPHPRKGHEPVEQGAPARP